MPKAFFKFRGVGKRKSAVARVYMNEGNGNFLVNERALAEYFPRQTDQVLVGEPFAVTETAGKFDVKVTVRGGGSSGQAQACQHGIARALLGVDPEMRQKLKVAGLLRRDAREKERKKYGQPGARKRFQYSKR